MKKVLLLAFCLFLTGAATRVKADPVTLTGIGSSSFEGIPAGPYSGTLNGSPLNILCLSIDRFQNIGDTWQATINTLTPNGVMNALYGARPDALLLYQRAAFLYDQMALNPAQTGDIHGAIWNLFNPTLTPDTAGSNFWLTFAMGQNLSSYDFSRFIILTPANTGSGGPQEFIAVIAPVPEPATIALLGTGIAGLSAWARRRRKAQAADENSDEAPA